MYDRQSVQRAIQELKSGRPILIFDSDEREAETDLVCGSEFITPEIIRTFRKDGGGLICTTVPPKLRNKLGLPYLSEIFYNNGHKENVLQELIPNDIPYDEISTFSITINHRKTFTGITDKDRALTITEFARIIPKILDASTEESFKLFGEKFRSPGHVHLLIASDNLLQKRFGHTELSTALMVMVGLIGSATICEMMGDDGNSLSKEGAKQYGEVHNIPFVKGSDIIEAWKAWSE
ncbi:MAG: 3,4-dihydroxy-2-butanone-4-phosphate synthase [Thermoplasmata archaeon]|nr:MAG: 3,4-dihydroxy-2-butanone-4-phosphate synthase [Thermoplasmata archaeon]